ncbi:MAG: DegT/DnrJ/EryC1/StrS family aminotransferase, partial [Bacteroidales bacterium]|nr:DegT/DnrJ/EryC1/StrS family aminotransferase [Bacteroidales bacterium]
AVHLALIILGVKSDDEVICSSFTFCGSVNPVIYQGAKPIFIDSEPETWNMNPVLLEKAIKDRINKGKKPKAIILVHLYGMPSKIDEIFSIADKYEIPVIEDAAEALGSEYKSKKLGSYGTMGILSFNGNKIITTSGGGALVSNNETYIKKARFLATQARDDAPHYEHTEIGYNYRMSNVLAAIGRGQLEIINERIKQKRANHLFYKEYFKNISGFKLLEEPSEKYFSNHWLSCITVDSSKTPFNVTNHDIRLALLKENIESRPLWKPMHIQPVFKNYPAYVNGTSEYLFNNGLCLPSGSNLTNNEKDRITACLDMVFKM